MTPSYLKVLLDGDESFFAPPLILLEAGATHELNRHPTCRLRYRQPPAARVFYESHLGGSLEIRAVDEEGAELQLFKGILQQVEAEWEMSGACLLTFIGTGASYKLDTFNRSQTFNEMSLQGAVSHLLDAQAGSYTCSEPSGNLTMVQYAETDWSFAHRILDRHRGFLRPVGGQIDVYDEFQGDPVQLPWRTENGLQVFRTSGKVVPYLLYGVNFSTKEATSHQVEMESADVPAEDSLPNLRSGAKSGSDTNGLASGLWNKFLSRDHTQFDDELDLESQRQLIHSCTAYGESRTPEVFIGNKVEVTGELDPTGKYGVFKLEHEWVPGHGYRNRFWCTPYKKYVDAVRPATERWYGPVIARVIDTVHPDRIAYVRVRFLWENNSDSGWIPVLTPNAGEKRGICFVPEIGDEVYVAFRDGDPCRPYIAGSLWNGVDTAPLDDVFGGEANSNDVKRIVTRSGNRIVFDDKGGNESVIVAGPQHVRVSLFDGGRTLVLHSDGNIHINAGGTVHIKASKFLREIG